MRPCSHCLSDEHECKISEDSDHCDSCVQSDISYDLIISSSKLSHIEEELLWLCAERDFIAAQKWEIKAKKVWLHKQISLLKKCQSELIQTELYNIKELKQKKLQAVKDLFLNSTISLTIFALKDFDFNLTASLVKDFSAETITAS